MASALYPSFKALLLNGDIDLATDTIKVALVDTGTYTYSSAHSYYSDITGVVGTPVTLSNKSISTTGVFDNTVNTTFSAVTGNSVEAVVIYKWVTSAADSPLIAYIEASSAVTPNGGDITVIWDDGVNKIFAL